MLNILKSPIKYFYLFITLNVALDNCQIHLVQNLIQCNKFINENNLTNDIINMKNFIQCCSMDRNIPEKCLSMINVLPMKLNEILLNNQTTMAKINTIDDNVQGAFSIIGMIFVGLIISYILSIIFYCIFSCCKLI